MIGPYVRGGWGASVKESAGTSWPGSPGLQGHRFCVCTMLDHVGFQERDGSQASWRARITPGAETCKTAARRLSQQSESTCNCAYAQLIFLLVALNPKHRIQQ